MKVISDIRIYKSKVENYEMKYKEKLSANRKAILFLRYNDNCSFVPAVKI